MFVFVGLYFQEELEVAKEIGRESIEPGYQI